jgi:hypothetical protein
MRAENSVGKHAAFRARSDQKVRISPPPELEIIQQKPHCKEKIQTNVSFFQLLKDRVRQGFSGCEGCEMGSCESHPEAKTFPARAHMTRA